MECWGSLAARMISAVHWGLFKTSDCVCCKYCSERGNTCVLWLLRGHMMHTGLPKDRFSGKLRTDKMHVDSITGTLPLR